MEIDAKLENQKLKKFLKIEKEKTEKNYKEYVKKKAEKETKIEMTMPPKLSKKQIKEKNESFNKDSFTVNHYHPLEWLNMGVDFIYTILSLPAREKKEKMKQLLKQSRDIGLLISDISKYSLLIPRECGYLLTYASIFLKSRYDVEAIKMAEPMDTTE